MHSRNSTHESHFDQLWWWSILLHRRLWISPWIKSISNELDIAVHELTSQVSGHCDVISNRLWRPQQNASRALETRGRCAKIFVFIVIYGFIILCLFPDLLSNVGNKHQSNPVVGPKTVRHSSSYITPYLFISLRITSLKPMQSCDYPSISESTRRNMDK